MAIRENLRCTCGHELKMATIFNCPHIVCSQCGETNKVSILRAAEVARKEKLRQQREAQGTSPKPPRTTSPQTATRPKAARLKFDVETKPIDPFDDREKSPQASQIAAPAPVATSADYSSLFAPRPLENDAASLERAERYDRLLLWLSVRENGSLSAFRGACESLGLASRGDGSARVLRRLRLLGHLETSPDGQKWSVAPPRRVITAADPNTTFIAGARDARLLDDVASHAPQGPTLQGNGAAPSRWTMPQISLEGAGALSQQLEANAPQDVALWLAERLPTLEGWTQGLEEITFANPASFDARRWHEGEFIWAPRCDMPGFYEFWEARDDQKHGWEIDNELPRQRLLRLEDGSWRRCDWYGARFAARCQSARVPVVLCESQTQLAVPYSWRWPEFYERALTLASGLLPTFVRHDQQLFLVYEGIPRPLLDACARALPLDTTFA